MNYILKILYNLPLIVFLALCLTLAYLNQSLWFDEAYSLAMIQRSWSEIIHFTSLDFHPPLYYFILKVFFRISGGSIFFVNLASILPSVWCLWLVANFLKKKFNKKAALLFGLSFLCTSTIIFQSLDVRMYTWALLFVTLSAINAYNLIKNTNLLNYTLYGLSLLATFYTQYYAALVVGIGHVFLLIYFFLKKKNEIPRILAFSLTVALLYLPWLWILIQQLSDASDSFWIPPLNLNDIISYAGIFFKSEHIGLSVITAVLFLYTFIKFILKPAKTFNDKFLFLCLTSVGVLIAFGIIISLTVRPLFVSRYLIPCFGLVWMFFAVQASELVQKNKLWNRLLITLLAALALANTTLIIKNPNYRSDKNYVHFTSFLQQNIKDSDTLVLYPEKESGQLIGIIALLFPNHKMAITHDKATRRENSSLDYYDSPFRMEIQKYNTVPKTGRKWLFIPTEARNPDISFFTQNQKTTEFGTFGWQSFRTGYKFTLYLLEEQP